MRATCLVIVSQLLTLLMSASHAAKTADYWPGYVPTKWFDEQVREIRFASQARAIVNAPLAPNFDPQRPTHLIIYTTPNGNTAEQTLGCGKAEGRDWHYYIQHVAAQVRRVRQTTKNNVVLACVQPNNRSWPTWRKQRENSDALIRQIVESLRLNLPATDVSVTLTGHSGGGSFLFGYLNAVELIPDYVQRIAFLDANYGYSTELGHGAKTLAWLRQDVTRQFAILAYDDRNIMLNGKKVVSETGGTFRASHRMLDWLSQQTDIAEDKLGEFHRYQAVDGRLSVLIHPNPENKILHTRLVGNMNGLEYVLSLGNSTDKATLKLAPPPTYTDWIQPDPYEPNQWSTFAPAIPARPADAPGGKELVATLLDAEIRVREKAILDAMLSGNVPDHLRHYTKIEIEAQDAAGQSHQLEYYAMPDYLAIGSATDYIRVPLTPQTGQHIADLFGCILPTRKMVDQIYQHANSQPEPRPLTEKREALSTFVQHHEIIEEQLSKITQPGLVAGIKKDVVLTNKLAERPNRVAIYGWHKTDGSPIQPLTTVHIDSYVDYSHGLRLVGQWAKLDGKPTRIADILQDETLSTLLSDEEPIEKAFYE